MKALVQHLYSKSIKSLWVICCLGLGLLPVLVGIFIYGMNLVSFYQQTVRNNEVMLMQMYDLTEKAFNDISNTAYEIMQSDYPGLYESVHSTSRKTAVKIQMQNWLSASRDRSLYISEAGVYFPEFDEVITDSTTASLDIIYYRDYRGSCADSSGLRDKILSVKTADLIVADNAEGERALVYIRRADVSRDNSPFILIRVDSGILNAMIENIEDYTFCELNFLLYGNGQYLYPASGQMNRLWEDSSFRPEAVIKRETVNGNDTVSYISSRYLNLAMVLYTPRKMAGYEITRINLYFLAGLFVLLLGSTGFTIFFIRTNYRPVRELLDMASDAGYLKEDGYGKISANEFAVLKEVISFSRHQNQNMEELMERQQKHLKQSVLALLLHNSETLAGNPEYAGLLKESFPFEYFRAAVMRLDSGKNEAERRLKEYLEKSMEDCAGKIRCVYLMKETDYMILLFNLREGEADASAAEKIVEGIAEQICEDGKPEQALFAVSPVHRGIAEISGAYQEADYALRYRVIFGDDIQNEEVKEKMPFLLTKSIYYEEDDERRLLNAVMEGEADQAGNIFREIWQRNTAEHNIPSEYMYFLLSDIVSTIIRAGNMVPLGKEISEYILESSREMMEEKSMDRLRKKVEILIHEVSCAYGREHDRSSERLKQRIYEYIEKNYADPNLNVEAVSDAFGRSRTNLFNLFKDGTGNSLLYHINRIRIQHAKELLRKTTKSVGVIAEETGFTSAVNFTRVFKKYTMQTPGRYRELHSEEK